MKVIPLRVGSVPIKAIIKLLYELSDYFDQYADVDSGQPNREMVLYTAIENLIDYIEGRQYDL